MVVGVKKKKWLTLRKPSRIDLRKQMAIRKAMECYTKPLRPISLPRLRFLEDG
jgi:hypothetical protein